MLWIVFDLDTPIILLLVICLLVLLFAVSVVGCLLGYSSCLVVWIPLFLDPSDGAFGRFDLAALCGCRTLNFCLFVCKGLEKGEGIFFCFFITMNNEQEPGLGLIGGYVHLKFLFVCLLCFQAKFAQVFYFCVCRGDMCF